MKSGRFGFVGKTALMVAATALILIGSRATAPVAAEGQVAGTGPATAQEQVLYNFQLTGEYGRYSVAGLIRDAAGNLYGTTTQSGEGKAGTVFELSPQSGGGWTIKVLHHFQENDAEGSTPAAGLVMDAAGNLYGTTQSGGFTGSGCTPGGCGAVFELSPQTGGGWTEKVLYSFLGRPDGELPTAGVILDSAGNVYGTTQEGGNYAFGECQTAGCGTVFELSPQSHGTWTEKVPYNFQGNPDGSTPRAGLVLDAPGNLYGTTYGGGNGGCCGTVFELLPKSGGRWVEKVLHTFQPNGPDGNMPYAGLIFDDAGNLYGTTVGGGSYVSSMCQLAGCGTVFELSPNSGKGWSEKVLYSFLNDPDGRAPTAGVIFDVAGNFYGTTNEGGSHSSLGTVFELSPQSGGTWSETVLHSFSGFHTDGSRLNGGVVLDPAGNLYSTTEYGGSGTCIPGCGTVFEVTP